MVYIEWKLHSARGYITLEEPPSASSSCALDATVIVFRLWEVVLIAAYRILRDVVSLAQQKNTLIDGEKTDVGRRMCSDWDAHSVRRSHCVVGEPHRHLHMYDSQSVRRRPTLVQLGTFCYATQLLTRHRASDVSWSPLSPLWSHVRRLSIRAALCCRSNETRAPIANPPNSAQLGATSYSPPTYIRVRAPVWAYGHGQTQRHTDRRAWPLYISRRLRLTRNVTRSYYNCQMP